MDDPDREMEDDILESRMGDEEKKEEEEESEEESADDDDANESDQEEAVKAAKFFETQTPAMGDDVEVFAELTLSRPLLRGIASMGYVKPTPIQSSVIPMTLAGQDIVLQRRMTNLL